MRRFRGTLILLVGILLISTGPAPVRAQEPGTTAPAAAAADSAGGEGNVVDKLLRRYFGNDRPSGEALGGRAVDMVSPYAAYEGLPIEVVIVSQVARFDDEWRAGLGTGTAVLNSVTTPFQTHTRDSTIRQYLLFKRGEKVDPFRLADTERLLRQLEYVEDVRILLVPLKGEIESVAVVVETRDRWPFGVSGKLKGAGWFEVSLYSSNVAGTGLRFDNRLVVREKYDPEVGYQGVLRQENLGGTFITGSLEFEDSYRRLQKVISFDRDVAYPGIRAVGGASWRRVRERDQGPAPDEREVGDYWGGWVVPLAARPVRESTSRPLLVPAARFSRTTFLDRPTVARDSLTRYHNNQNYLTGVTYQNLRYLRTSYLFGMGETENLPDGFVSKLSGGYQDGEFHDRGQLWLENFWVRARESGSLVALRANWGGFFRSGKFEDGRLLLGALGVTPLLDKGDWSYRFLGRISYQSAQGGSLGLQLGDRTGLRGMDNDQVFGDRRLVGSLEHRAFTPWSLLGFRFMLLGFLDAGTTTARDEPVLGGKYYVSAGVGVWIRNPDLVLPALQMRVALLNSITDKGVVVGFKVGNVGSVDIAVPSSRPGSFVLD
ncbi:hypothetical protein KDM41_07725 [bacterium]|nr:hypothetical protein [bacterium]